ncbi:hypothetical protein [Chondromyces apiculatus]|uniref:Bacterial surface antigen (D15) domain-containing protein n=1 Tax=Chondromyces apiculatus DSM 436 TaxID=1192034 RepID=A0A017ST47_9BACT|nr:hypothetical protein [Chondromyces apiculatus]EYF00163.1 Hypothetical protein CAP_1124 [Chondromyces apiculatus DSM 436]
MRACIAIHLLGAALLLATPGRAQQPAQPAAQQAAQPAAQQATPRPAAGTPPKGAAQGAEAGKSDEKAAETKRVPGATQHLRKGPQAKGTTPSKKGPPPTGVERAAVHRSDGGRVVAGSLLALPRAVIDLIFITGGMAAGLVQDEQVVPRVINVMNPEVGVGVFPTAFAETGRGRFSVGARMVGNLGNLATGIRAGFGGLDEVVVESRIRLGLARPRPAVFTIEALADRRTDLEYYGVGQVPSEDPRNQFLEDAQTREALYRERRLRFIAAAGFRPFQDVEGFFSASITRRQSDDPRDAAASALSRVFVPGSVPGAAGETRFVYVETALRIDTRASRVRPAPGVMAEVYGGASVGDERRGPTIWLARVGGRAVGSIPLVRPTTTLSPKLVVDGVSSIEGDLPFSELSRQPDFRGFDTRRDRVSVVASLDHRWLLARYTAARIFIDAATVGPNPGEIDFAHPRVAAGVGFDLNSATNEVGRTSIAFSPEGVRVLLNLGVSQLFGDRQHRD